MVLTFLMPFYIFCLIISTIAFCSSWKQKNSALLVINGLAMFLMILFFLSNLPEWIRINF